MHNTEHPHVKGTAMLIHTTLFNVNPVTGLAAHINVRKTDSNFAVRAVTKKRSNFLVPYISALTPEQNHINAMRRFWAAELLFQLHWVYTQESATMYRFTAVDTNWLQMDPHAVQPAPVAPDLAPAFKPLDVA